MRREDLREEIEIEVERMRRTIEELSSLVAKLPGSELGVVEKTAAGAFLAQLYSGVENTLKRICQYQGFPLPEGPQWHDELFRRFTEAGKAGLPMLFDHELAQDLDVYRRFRHVFTHAYGIDLDWDRMREGAMRAPEVFDRVFAAVRDYVAEI